MPLASNVKVHIHILLISVVPLLSNKKKNKNKIRRKNPYRYILYLMELFYDMRVVFFPRIFLVNVEINNDIHPTREAKLNFI